MTVWYLMVMMLPIGMGKVPSMMTPIPFDDLKACIFALDQVQSVVSGQYPQVRPWAVCVPKRSLSAP